jgi:hypothetical protein
MKSCGMCRRVGHNAIIDMNDVRSVGAATCGDRKNIWQDISEDHSSGEVDRKSVSRSPIGLREVGAWTFGRFSHRLSLGNCRERKGLKRWGTGDTRKFCPTKNRRRASSRVPTLLMKLMCSST